MNTGDLEFLTGRRRLQTLRLMEANDVSRQLGEALDRRDEVSVKLLLTMREAPIQRAVEIQEEIDQYLQQMPESDAIRCQALLKGAEAIHEEEKALCQQVGQYYRTVNTAIEMDKPLNKRLSGRKSIYNKFR